MFGELVAAYLFLAGTGAGGMGAACLADLIAVRTPFGAMTAGSVSAARPADRLVAFALAASMGALMAGAVCLMADLGRIDRVLALFLTPALTLMNGGAWALAALIAVGAALVLARFLYLPWLSRRVVVALEAIAVILAAVVAVYAGLLLQMLPGVRLWSPLWVPVLFTLSAASCGCALLWVAALFVEDAEAVRSVLRGALGADAAIVVGELTAAAAFLAGALGSEHPGVAASAESLLHGAAALSWWCGFMLCGVVLPLAIEAVLWWRGRTDRSPSAFAPASPPMVLAVLAACVLVGGAGLRWAMIGAGEPRPLELQDPAAFAVPVADGPSDAVARRADVAAAAASATTCSTAEREEFVPWSS